MKNKLLIYMLFVLPILACEQIIPVDFPPMEKKLVVNCLFRPDSLFEVFVGKAFYPDDSLWVNDNAFGFRSYPYHYIENAKVEIYEQGQLAEQLEHVEKGLYKARALYPKPGKMYALKAFVDGYPEITAQSYMPVPVCSDTVIIGKDKNLYGELGYLLTNRFLDPAEENYYGIDLKFINSNLRVDFTSSDPVFESIQNEELDYRRQYFFNDGLFNGKTHNLAVFLARSVYRIYFSEPRPFEYRLLSLSKDYYQYFSTIVDQEGADGSFEEIPMVYSNINNGKGIFAGWCFSTDTVSLPPPWDFLGY